MTPVTMPEEALREGAAKLSCPQGLLLQRQHLNQRVRRPDRVCVCRGPAQRHRSGGYPVGPFRLQESKLAAVFYRLNLIEAYGTGMPKILKAYAGSGVKPKIEVSSNAFKITLPNRNSATRDLTAVSDTTKSKEEQILAWIERTAILFVAMSMPFSMSVRPLPTVF